MQPIRSFMNVPRTFKPDAVHLIQPAPAETCQVSYNSCLRWGKLIKSSSVQGWLVLPEMELSVPKIVLAYVEVADCPVFTVDHLALHEGRGHDASQS